jgi:RsiW-degrading membrane proteinase PrsW (M82 family)
MVAVIIVLPLQRGVDQIFPNMVWQAFVLWALLEEGFKLAAAYFGGLHTPEDNEPIDPLIYMITAALGFVALENSLFIATSFLEEGSVMAVITGNMRFVGASLLHTFTSSIIGVAIGLSFYKRYFVRNIYALVAFILAIGFHTVFNLTLFKNTETGATLAFGVVWIGIALIILMF